MKTAQIWVPHPSRRRLREGWVEKLDLYQGTASAVPKTITMTSQSLPSTRDQDTIAGLAGQHRRFLQFLRNRVDSSAAEDILQAAYLKAIERGSQLRQAESSVAWFYRILRNAIADHYRRQASDSRAMDSWAAEWKEVYEPEIKSEVCACIQEAVEALKPEYRAAIEQVDLRGESLEAFAHAQHTTANNASVRLHRARKAVAKQLTAICGTCATHHCIDCACKG